MINFSPFAKFLFIAAFVCTIFECSQENVVSQGNSTDRTIRPVCSLGKNLSADEIDNAVAVVKGDEIKDSLVFLLKTDLLSTPKKLYGTFEMPSSGSNWTITIRMFDGQKRKIGEGKLKLDDSFFKVGKYTANVAIGINSAKPAIDTCKADTLNVGVNDTIRLHCVAHDNDSNGSIVNYEWKFGESEWEKTGKGDTNIIAPEKAQAYPCSLRVTDNDGNIAMDDLLFTVETRGPSANAGPDTAVGINDTINLHGSGADETAIAKYEWKLGTGAWITTSHGDTNIVAPATAQAHACSLKVTDDDGNNAKRAITVTVETRPPTAKAGPDTSVGINDTIKLHGTGKDETAITKYEWKFGTGAWVTTSRGDTNIIAPETAKAFVCSLRVTDDDGNNTKTAMTVTVETRPPTAIAGRDTAVFVNGQIRLHGSSSFDETRIAQFAWKCGNENWSIIPSGDTIISAPSTEQIFVCSLKVVDDEGNISFDKKTITTANTKVTDIDGNQYDVVLIGSQAWTVQNLRTTRYNYGTEIALVTDNTEWTNTNTGAYCFYGNSTDSANTEKWGALYNWYAVQTGKLAPAGWHVPSDEDWDTLQNFLIAHGYNYDITTTGNKLAKAIAIPTEWKTSPNLGTPGKNLSENNRSGFSALPGGYRDNFGNYSNQSVEGLWWGADENTASLAFYRDLFYSNPTFFRTCTYKGYGVSVRLVSDSAQPE
jgi:uncharacterized protein (TIGR02145 family)